MPTVSYSHGVRALNGAVSPAWVNSDGDQKFGLIPATDTANCAAVFDTAGDPYPVFNAFTGLAFDSDNWIVYAVGNGGHTDDNGQSVYRWRLNLASVACDRVVTRTAASDPPNTQNGTLARGDGTRTADHGYSTHTYAAGKVWLPWGAAFASASGQNSTEAWYWDPSNPGSATLGYTNLGKSDAAYDFSGGGFYETGAGYDPTDRKVWTIAQEWSGTANALKSYSVDSPYTLTNYSGMAGTGSIPFKFLIHPGRRVAILLGQLGLLRMDLTSPGTLTSCTESGTPFRTKTGGAVLDPTANGGLGAVYCWDTGTTMSRLLLPSSLSGTYAWDTVTIAGTAPTAASSGTWGKMGLITMPGGEKIIIIGGGSGVPFADRLTRIRVPANGFT